MTTMTEEWKRGDIIVEIGDDAKYVVEDRCGFGCLVRMLTEDGPENCASILHSSRMEMFVKIGEWDFIKNHETGGHEDGQEG